MNFFTKNPNLKKIFFFGGGGGGGGGGRRGGGGGEEVRVCDFFLLRIQVRNLKKWIGVRGGVGGGGAEVSEFF